MKSQSNLSLPLKTVIIFVLLLLPQMNCQQVIYFRVVEECQLQTIVGNLHKEIFQHDSTDPKKYSYKSVKNTDPFYIDTENHNIIVTKRIDRESICRNKELNNQNFNDYLPNCQMHFRIIQIPFIDDSIVDHRIYKVTIEILDINDNPPSWPSPRVHFELAEHSKRDTKLSLPLAFDPDQPPVNTTKLYKISHQTVLNGFILQHSYQGKGKQSLWLKVNKDFDRETQTNIIIKIDAFDGGPQPLAGHLDINISLIDINDKKPVFLNRDLHETIMENIAQRTKILTLQAVDEDSSDKNRLIYQFDNSVDESVRSTFYINPNTGEIFTSNYIDYEERSKYVIPVIVSDGKHLDRTTVTITVENVNDNPPQITVMYVSGSKFKTPPHSSQYRITIMENKNPGYVLASFSVSDADYNNNNNRLSSHIGIDCKIRSKGDYLDLKPYSKDMSDYFRIVTTKKFDRELISQYYAELVCTDNDNKKPKSSSVTFEIFVLDENDNAPIFKNPPADMMNPVYPIKENSPVGTVVVRVSAYDKDIGQNANIEYSLNMGSKYFTIDSLSGEIRTRQEFDFEQIEKYELKINASNPIIKNHNNILLYTMTKIIINVVDVNDCPPEFSKDRYQFDIKEGNTKDMVVGKIDVKDKDKSPIFNTNYFKILPNHPNYYLPNQQVNPRDYFRISETGFIYVNVPQIDREAINSFSFKVMAKDRSEQPLSSTVLVQINVEDINDNDPQFIFPSPNGYTVNVSYQESVGHCIAQLKSTDPDLGDSGKVEYGIVSPTMSNDMPNNKNFDSSSTHSSVQKVTRFGLFDIEKSTGNIYVAQKMLLKDVGPKALWVEARDKGEPPRKAYERLMINVVNSNKIDEYAAKNPYQKSFGFTKNGFENDLMIMIVLVAIVILVAVVMVIIILMLRCRNVSRMNGSIVQSSMLSKTLLERRPDGHSCSPVNEVCQPYPTGPKRSHTISTYLGGQCGGSSQMLDFAAGYLTNPNSRTQLDMSHEALDPTVCQSMTRLTAGGHNHSINPHGNNSTFAKKYYTSSALYRPNTLWSTEASPELSRRLCQRLNNEPQIHHQSHTSPAHSDPSMEPPSFDSETQSSTIGPPTSTTKKSITLPNFLSAIDECDDPNNMQSTTTPGSDLDSTSTFKQPHRLSVTWIDKIDQHQDTDQLTRHINLNKSIDSCLNNEPNILMNNKQENNTSNHEYTQLRILPQSSQSSSQYNNLSPSHNNNNDNNNNNSNNNSICNDYPVTYV